ncbi:FemAB family XrtA/PEP-CTERM system-associated protein [Motiliproteus sp. SC1-56]|uniref:FemAB family XrtA/PEP-CTERM system-associated protein n=1 Tax=Motiliproteus sp. SC1-56 TaxID=2799565 RepID=UPI001A8CA597|nr:FemAB family XrtA/PEP-CTERM system-associated protein [Motiliproteus sp. SC1-56]
MIVETLTPEKEASWDAYVNRAQDATFFHLSGWLRAIEKTTSHRSYALYAEKNGKLTGVLPLVHTKSLLFGNALVSTPFCVYGGVVADDPESKEALLKRAQEVAEQIGVDYLELRHREPQTAGWPAKNLHATFRRQLDDDDEANLKAMKRKQRAVIRQAIRNGHETLKADDINDFFTIYSTSVRNLGTPVFSRHFFEALRAEFPEATEVVTVLHDNRPVSALMSFYFRNEVLPYYGGGLPEARDLKSMDFMYWDQMCRARKQGVEIYDFGRSKVDSGPYHYKRHWGFEPASLCYEYHLVKAKALPNLSPNNPKYRFFIKLWQKLPLNLSQFLGPRLSRHLG